MPRGHQDVVDDRVRLRATGGDYAQAVVLLDQIDHLVRVQGHGGFLPGPQQFEVLRELTLECQAVHIALRPVLGGQVEGGIAGVGVPLPAPFEQRRTLVGPQQAAGALDALVRGEGDLPDDAVEEAGGRLVGAVHLAGAELAAPVEHVDLQLGARGQAVHRGG